MARAKKALEELDILAPAQEDFDLEEFLESVGPGTSVIDIFRVKTDGSTPRVGRVTLDVLREDVYGYLAETFGTGKYDLQFKGSDKRIRAQKRLAVEASGPPTNHQNGNGNGNGSGNGTERELMLALIASLRPPPPVDIGSLLQGLAAMRPVLPPSPDPVALFTALITGMATLKGNNSDDGMERLQKMMALVKDMMPEGRQEENLYTVVKDIGTKVVDAIKPRPVSGAVELPVAAAVQEAPAALPAPDPFTVTEDTLQQWIKNQLAYLKMKAKADKDPAAWVDYIFENDDEPGCHAVLIAMERGVTFDMLCDFDTEIKSNPQLNTWFRKLYDGLHAELHPSVDTAGGTGNVGDPAPNADAGASGNDTYSAAGAPARKSRKR